MTEAQLLVTIARLTAALSNLYHALPPSMDGNPVVQEAYQALVHATGKKNP